MLNKFHPLYPKPGSKLIAAWKRDAPVTVAMENPCRNIDHAQLLCMID